MKRAAILLVVIACVGAIVWLRPSEQHEMAGRSPEWRTARANHLISEPFCVACGRGNDIEVHHIKPFHKHPELELDPGNLVTLCRRCHFLIGHLDNWTSWNEDVRDDSAFILRRIRGRPAR